MKAFLIDPFAQVITEVDHNGDYRQIYEFIKADCFDAVRFGPYGDAIYLDDDGLFKPMQAFFKLKGYDQPLAGRGLLLGSDSMGETREPKTSLAQLQAMIMWPERPVRFAGMMHSEGKTDHPIMGKGVTVISNTPVFEAPEGYPFPSETEN